MAKDKLESSTLSVTERESRQQQQQQQQDWYAAGYNGEAQGPARILTQLVTSHQKVFKP
jgi:uncharacterized protein YgiM (DUF1202 family)